LPLRWCAQPGRCSQEGKEGLGRKEGRRKEGKGGEGEKEERREEMSQPLS
jgi:hypothetical protein